MRQVRDTLDGLTEDQARFVLDMGRVVVLHAGPGTGKTFTLARRVAHLLTTRGFAPGEVLPLSFTVAAAESLGRALRSVGQPASAVAPRTLHGVAYGALRRMWDAQGVPGLTPASEEESEAVFRSLFEGPRRRRDVMRLGVEAARAALRRHAAGLPEEDLDDLVVDAYRVRHRDVGKVALDHLPRLAVESWVDLVDLLWTHARHIVVDEAHDVTLMERRFIDLLAHATNSSLSVALDPRQQIYEWRGTTDDAADFHGEVHHLVRTWRFGTELATLANRVAAVAAPDMPRIQGDPDVHTSVSRTVTNREMPLDLIPEVLGGLHAELGDDVVVLTRSNRAADEINSYLGLPVAKTVHQAKGAEHDAVIVLGSPYWPARRVRREDWRILYVALTRARRALHVVTAANRTLERLTN